MRIVDLSGHARAGSIGNPGDAERERQLDCASEPPHLPMRSQLLGPGHASGDHQLLRRLRDPLTARHAVEVARVEDRRDAAPSDIEAVRAARHAGAENVARDLDEHLGDEWVLLRGYQNSGGVLGQLLLGPRGLVAMTSLYLHATVHCHGDDWHADRFDKQEQFIGRMYLDDRSGRSPSTQLNQAADVLEQLLRSSGAPIAVLRVVLLNHPWSRRGNCHRPTVDIFASTIDLLTWLHKMPRILDPGERRRIEDCSPESLTL